MKIISAMIVKRLALPAIAALSLSGAAHADVYAYVNDDGDYVVSKERPTESTEYAILTDEGEFVRLVKPRDLDVPITHWRPWFLPAEPDPFGNDPELPSDREGTVDIEEVD